MATTSTLPRPRSQAHSGDPFVATSGPVLDLSVTGLLDEQAGRSLLGAVTDAAETGWHRVEIDLSAVTAHTSQGTAALTKLCRTGSLLPAGIGFSTTAGPGQRALVASLADA